MNYQKNKLSNFKSGRFTKSSLAIAVMATFSLSAQAFNGSSDVEDLEKQVSVLTKQVAKLSKAVTVETKGGGLAVENKAGNKSFEMGGRFQLDLNVFDGAYNANNDGKTGSDLFPRRVRTYVEGQSDAWDYKLLLDFSENTGEITMARLRYKGFDNGPTIKLGKIREDISLEALTSSKHITGISRPMLANAMSPYFKFGASAYQYFKDSGVRYAIGAYKGGSFGSNGKDENDNLALSYTGRLTWSPVHTKDETLHFGMWASKRDFGGATMSNKVARGEVRETNVRLADYAAGGAKFDVDSLDQVGIEFASVNGPLSFQAEYAKRDVNAVNSLNDSTQTGYYVTASYFLTGESRVYKKRGVFNSPKPLSTDGAWEVFARMSNYDTVDNNQGTKAEVMTLGVNYYLNKKIKIMANYLSSDVEGPGTQALVGQYTDGDAITARIQYLF